MAELDVPLERIFRMEVSLKEHAPVWSMFALLLLDVPLERILPPQSY